MERYEQLELPLFSPPTFETLLAAQRISTLRVECHARLTHSWQVHIDRHSGMRRLRIPAMLASAPQPIKQAILDWVLLYDRRGALRRVHRPRKRALEQLVWHYLEEHHPAPRRAARPLPLQQQLRTAGCRYDLLEVFAHVNHSCFEGRLRTLLRWGAFASLTSYHRVITGPDASTHNLITIAGAYDHPDVPRFAIEALMHHELLHIAIPPVLRNAKRVVHVREFRAAEKAYVHFSRWNQWQKTHAARCAQSLRRRRKRV